MGIRQISYNKIAMRGLLCSIRLAEAKAGLSVVINDLIHVVGKFGLYLHPMECPRLIFSLCVCVCVVSHNKAVWCARKLMGK